MLPPLPPPVRVRVRKLVCVRACALMCDTEYCSVRICVYVVTCKFCNQGTAMHTYNNSSFSMNFTCIRVLLRAERIGGPDRELDSKLRQTVRDGF